VERIFEKSDGKRLTPTVVDKAETLAGFLLDV
jgi:hypothetical protein